MHQSDKVLCYGQKYELTNTKERNVFIQYLWVSTLYKVSIAGDKDNERKICLKKTKKPQTSKWSNSN